MFESCQLLVKECALGTGYLLRLSLPQKSMGRKSVGRITDYSNMTSAVYHERKATNQTNKLCLSS